MGYFHYSMEPNLPEDFCLQCFEKQQGVKPGDFVQYSNIQLLSDYTCKWHKFIRNIKKFWG
jgi:hypothetical protein